MFIYREQLIISNFEEDKVKVYSDSKNINILHSIESASTLVGSVANIVKDYITIYLNLKHSVNILNMVQLKKV